jgi:transposase-like protein
MSDGDLLCPRCASDEHLSGERHEKLIRITCSACKLSWDRDPSPHCPICGSTAVEAVPQAVLGKVRGNQLSLVGTRVVYLCPTCDRERLRQARQTNAPLPPDVLPTAEASPDS